MSNAGPITVKVMVKSSLRKVWDYWTKPEHIVGWAFASDDWEAPHAENDVHAGGRFKTTMAAKDKSSRFDFTGTYTKVVPNGVLEYTIDDGRKVSVIFTELAQGVQVTEMFDPENTHTREQQREGWQAILENFKKYVEAHHRKHH